MGSTHPRCDAVRCDAMRCDEMRCDAMRCDAWNGWTSPASIRVVESFSTRFERRLRLLHDSSQLANGVRRATIVVKCALVVARGRSRANLSVENSSNRLERVRARIPLYGSAGFHVARGQFAEFFTRRELCSKISLGYLWINPRVLALGTGLHDVLVLIVLCQDFRVLADVEIRQSVETFFVHRGAVVRDRRLGLCVEQPQICEKESVQFQNMMITRTSILFPDYLSNSRFKFALGVARHAPKPRRSFTESIALSSER